jgi:TolB-like protein/DNA-binding winged helix-turn-helix (wHTH) protein
MSAQGRTPDLERAAGSTREVSANAGDAAGAAPALTLRFSTYELDFARVELRRAGTLVPLQPTPLRVLLYLAEHRDRTVPRRELLDAIWPGVVVGDEALTTALAEARHAVGDDGAAQRVIRTLKGQGYRFVAEAAERADIDAPTAAGRPSRTRLWIAVGAAAVAAAAIGSLLAPRPPPTPAPFPFGVAVLAIANLTGDARDRGLADGLTAQISHTLSQNGYPVVSRTTAAVYRDRAVDVRELASTLGVSHVLEGSVQRGQGRVRVTMQLVAADTGLNVWSEAFEQPGDDAFAIQDRVTDRVAVQVYRYVWEDAVAMKRNPELAQLGRLFTESRRLFIEDRNEDHVAAATRLVALAPRREPFLWLRGAVSADLSTTWAKLYGSGSRPLSEAGPKLLEFAKAAVADAPNNAWAHNALSRAFAHYWQWERAEHEMRRACELAPRHGIGCGTILNHVCSALGCVEEALDGARLFREQFPAEAGSWA